MKRAAQFAPYVDTAQQPLGLSARQTAGAYNNERAMADAMASPRATMKAFDRPGFSRGKGQEAVGAAAGAQAYAAQMDKADRVPLQDYNYNTGIGLQQQSSQNQFGSALAKLLEQARHQTAMNELQRQAMGSNYGGILSGLA